MGALEDQVQKLQGVVDGLETRIKSLEQRGFGGAPAKTIDELRMILIGPPGAGMSPNFRPVPRR